MLVSNPVYQEFSHPNPFTGHQHIYTYKEWVPHVPKIQVGLQHNPSNLRICLNLMDIHHQSKRSPLSPFSPRVLIAQKLFPGERVDPYRTRLACSSRQKTFLSSPSTATTRSPFTTSPPSSTTAPPSKS